MAIRVGVGATVVPGGDALLELGDPTRLLVVAQVPEGELRRVAVGQDAEIELPALSGAWRRGSRASAPAWTRNRGARSCIWRSARENRGHCAPACWRR